MSYKITNKLFSNLTSEEANSLLNTIKNLHLKGVIDWKHPAWIEYIKVYPCTDAVKLLSYSSGFAITASLSIAIERSK